LTEYTTELQQFFLEIMMHNPECFVRVRNIYNAKNFTTKLQKTATLFAEYSDEYKTLPDKKQVELLTGLKLNELDESTKKDDYVNWFMDSFEEFTRKQELERAIIKGADLIEQGDFDPVEKLVKDAVQISLTKDMGTDYFADPETRLKAIKDNNGQLSTGWPNLDKQLYGGFNRGELEIFAGQSGSGKSLFLQNLAINFIEQGKNGIFLTLELSEELCCMRIDSMMTGIASKNIFKNLDDVALKVGMKGKKCGNLRVKYLAAQSTVNDISAYIRELQIQTDKKIDFICVDYLDLVMPNGVKVSPSDQFIKDKYVSEELRNLGKEFDIVVISASQLNRSSVEEVEFDHSHISGGISKINSSDNVFAIFTSRAMKEQGRYQLQLMKTRSSAGVGNKVDLAFDIDSLRITDDGLDSQDYTTNASTSAIMNSIKNKTTISEPDGEVGKPGKSGMNSKMNNLMNRIHNK